MKKLIDKVEFLQKCLILGIITTTNDTDEGIMILLAEIKEEIINRCNAPSVIKSVCEHDFGEPHTGMWKWCKKCLERFRQ